MTRVPLYRRELFFINGLLAIRGLPKKNNAELQEIKQLLFEDTTPAAYVQAAKGQLHEIFWQQRTLIPDSLQTEFNAAGLKDLLLKDWPLAKCLTERQKAALLSRIRGNNDPSWLIDTKDSWWPTLSNSPAEIYSARISQLIDSLDGIFDYKEISLLLDNLASSIEKEKEPNVSSRYDNLGYCLWHILFHCQFLINFAVEHSFDLSALKLIIANTPTDTGANLYFEEARLAIIAGRQSGWADKETAALFNSLGRIHRKPESRLHIAFSVTSLPSAIASGLSKNQIIELLARLSKSSNMSGHHFKPFRKFLETAGRLKSSPALIIRTCKKQMRYKGYAFASLPNILELSIKILGLEPDKIFELWEYVLDFKSSAKSNSSADLGMNFDINEFFETLETKLLMLSTFAGPTSIPSQQLKKQIEKKDIFGIKHTPLFYNEQDCFPEQEGPLIISNQAYKTKRSRKQGEQDLQKLALSSNQEGVWFYSDSQKFWYCLGGSTSTKDSKTHHSFYSFRPEELAPDCQLYHLHPLPLIETWFEILKDKTELDPTTINKLLRLDCALPSTEDITTFGEYFRLRGIVDFIIVHPQGLTHLYVSPGITDSEIQKFADNFYKQKVSLVQELQNNHSWQPTSDLILAGIQLLNQQLPNTFRITFVPNQPIALSTATSIISTEA